MAPIIPTTSTPPYIRFAGLPSFPMMPTAAFIQMRRNAARSAMPTANRYTIWPDFLDTSSYVRPVPNRRTLAKTKSLKVQTTSSVNCIAIKGISNKSAVTTAMPIILLFCIMINVMFSQITLADILMNIQRGMHFSTITEYSLWKPPCFSRGRKQARAYRLLFSCPNVIYFLL